MSARLKQSKGKRRAASAKSSTADTRLDFLFEIGCEEIPAGMIAKACDELKAILGTHLATHALVDEPTVQQLIETFGAPRRLVAMVHGVKAKQEYIVKEITGPPKSVAYDAAGQPTRAAVSFAEKQGVPLSKLELLMTPKGEFLGIKKLVVGRRALEVLAEELPHVIREISWPRSMYWTSGDSPRFIRPIRWIVALLGEDVVPFTFADVKSGRATEGHRFLGKPHIRIDEPAAYEAKLKQNFVLFRPEARRNKIAFELRSVIGRKPLRAREDAGLLEAVTYLNEYPSVILGDFSPKYLELPDEILTTVMRGHQKYFAVEDRSGALAPHFLAVINLPKDPKGLVRAGHERVLRARFADAQFFWQADQRCKLGDYLPKLNGVTYERRLGSYGDKVERMRALARWLAEQWFASGVTEADVAGADRAAELAKCDLVTEMVGEFPELQGIVGGLYAHVQGEPDEIASAVYDHYRPLGLDDPVPGNLTGCTVALADKLDSIVACFAVGAIPTGSSDPFALRRAAIGIIKIILERRLPISVLAAIACAARNLHNLPPKVQVSEAVQAQVAEFLLERARYMLRERQGFAYDEINAALTAGSDDLVDAVDRINAIRAIRNTKNFGPLAASFKRIRNILEKSTGEKDRGQIGVNRNLLKEAAELQLYTAAQRIGEEASRRKKERKYKAALEKISELRPAVDFFFDKVHVMAEDQEVRQNRVALLGNLLKEFSTIADFSELGAEERKN